MQLDAFEKHPAWKAVLFVLNTLRSKGHDAYLAGGCVRDGLIQKTPKDFDVASDALPHEVEGYFTHTIGVGKSFGVIIVHHQGFNVEVTTFRNDGIYHDGRRPENVQFSNPEEDAKRRDFTINALFYDPFKKNVIDFVNGIEDIKLKSIRAVGDAKVRFTEDKLRMMRAVRFAAELDFEIEESTWRAICEQSPQIGVVSAERITDEMRKIIISDNLVKGFFLLKTSRILTQIWPTLRFFESSLYENYFYKGLEQIGTENRVELALALLIMLEVQFEAEHVGMDWRVGVDRELFHLHNFKFSRDVVRSVSGVLRDFSEALKLSTESLVFLSEDSGVVLLELMRIHFFVRGIKSKEFESFIERYTQLCEKDGRLPKNLVDGNDLQKLKIPAGPIYTEILNRAYLEQLNKKTKRKDDAIAYVKILWSQMKD